MQAFVFEKSPPGPSPWGECEEIVILSETEGQAWEILQQENTIGFRCKDWRLVEVKELTPGLLFATSYTIGF